jgi:hypothetical protein
MKKILIIILALGLTLGGLMGKVSACTSGYCTNEGTEFTDINSFKNWFDTNNPSYTWHFDLDNDVLTPNSANIDSNDNIIKAYLSINFYDDYDWEQEYATVVYDGLTFRSNFEVDTQTVTFSVLSKLNSDHTLDVTVTRNSGDFGVNGMKIQGCYTEVLNNVPEPTSLLFLGSGLLGLGFFCRKKLLR